MMVAESALTVTALDPAPVVAEVLGSSAVVVALADEACAPTAGRGGCADAPRSPTAAEVSEPVLAEELATVTVLDPATEEKAELGEAADN